MNQTDELSGAVAPGRRLTILLACPVGAWEGEGLVISTKFLEELQEYARLWPGPVRVIAEQQESWSSAFGTQVVQPGQLPFELILHSHANLDPRRVFEGSDVVLSASGTHYHDLSQQALTRGIPLVYVTEYSLKTARAIMRLETRSTLLRLRRELWLRQNHVRQRRSLQRAAAVQCNGTPTFSETEGVNERRLLYFDSRIFDDLVITDSALTARHERMMASSVPLRLVFSGRLDRMKGVQYLVPLARELSRLNVDCTLDICGGGELATQLAEQVAESGLGSRVKIRGSLDFSTQLMPFVRGDSDVFVCCHPQGDPSCTYLEMFACGVPCVGFANEALFGLAERSKAVWLSPIGDIELLAKQIGYLSSHRQEVMQHSQRALTFAQQHTFRLTYARRVEQLQTLTAG